jgi:hypothetical protein
VKAPWSKSGAASFSFTVIIVSVTAAVAIATVVMWILKDVTGEWVFWLVFKILGASWWVVMVGLVLARIAIFAKGKYGTIGEEKQPESNS